MSRLRRWLESLLYAGICSILYPWLIRKGMWWWIGSSWVLLGAYSLLLWRTLMLLRHFIYGSPQVALPQMASQPILLRRVILEEEVPWERS